jgi:hypothetical protein
VNCIAGADLRCLRSDPRHVQHCHNRRRISTWAENLRKPDGDAVTRRMNCIFLAGLMLMWPLAGRAANLAIVLNSADASVSIVDMDRKTELRRVRVLREPHHLALSPDGRRLLVGDTSGNEMLFLDPGTGDVLSRMPVTDPYQLGFSPDGVLAAGQRSCNYGAILPCGT